MMLIRVRTRTHTQNLAADWMLHGYILSGRQNHNQVLLKTCSSISKKPMQGKDQDQVWADMPGWVVYGAN